MKKITPSYIIIKLPKVIEEEKSPRHLENKGHINNREMRMAEGRRGVGEVGVVKRAH